MIVASAGCQWYISWWLARAGVEVEVHANPGRIEEGDGVLIDDADANFETFCAAGGDAILFPQPWNSNFAIHDRLSHVKMELERLSASSKVEAILHGARSARSFPPRNDS